MGKRGPKAQPTPLKIARGSAKKNPQRINKLEPEVPAGRPEKPAHLSDFASAEWDKVGGILESMGLMSPVYAAMLECYCNAYSRWREAEATVDREGMFVSDGHGNPKRHPALNESHACHAEMYKWLCEMGLTPSSKTRVSGKGAEHKQGSRWAQFLGGGKSG